MSETPYIDAGAAPALDRETQRTASYERLSTAVKEMLIFESPREVMAACGVLVEYHSGTQVVVT